MSRKLRDSLKSFQESRRQRFRYSTHRSDVAKQVKRRSMSIFGTYSRNSDGEMEATTVFNDSTVFLLLLPVAKPANNFVISSNGEAMSTDELKINLILRIRTCL